MQDRQRNKGLPAGENPFFNDTMYPVYVVLSCSFFDSYIQHHLHSYNVMLPGNPKYNTKNVYMMQVNKELNKLLDVLMADITKLSDGLNNNNLKNMKIMYNNFKAASTIEAKCSAKEIRDRIIKDSEEKGIEIDATTLNIFDEDDFASKLFTKKLFLNYLTDKIIDDFVNPTLDKHSSNTHNLLTFMIDESNMVCVNRYKGILGQDSSTMNPMQLSYILGTSRDLFANYNSRNSEKTDIIFILDIHLFINIKGRPFMMLTNVNKKTVKDGNITYINSNDLIECRNYENGDADLPEDYPPDDDYDDWDDEDDE